MSNRVREGDMEMRGMQGGTPLFGPFYRKGLRLGKWVVNFRWPVTIRPAEIEWTAAYGIFGTEALKDDWGGSLGSAPSA